jgi:hypothetical protein
MLGVRLAAERRAAELGGVSPVGDGAGVAIGTDGRQGVCDRRALPYLPKVESYHSPQLQTTPRARPIRRGVFLRRLLPPGLPRPKRCRLSGLCFGFNLLILLVEPDGIEPTTSSMPLRESSVSSDFHGFPIFDEIM